MIRFLQQDNRVVKAVFWLIIVGVSAFMVITLVPGIYQSSGDSSTDYAVVRMGGILGGRFFAHSEPIEQQDVQRLAERQLQQQKLPEAYLPFIESRAAQQLIQTAMLKHQADKMGLAVTDNDLRGELKTGQFGEYLFPNGTFIGDDQYANFISTQFNMSVEKFESELKKEMEIQRLQQFVTAPVTVTAGDVRKEYLGANTKVKFQYAVISPGDVRSQINPSDAELQSFFKAHSAQYANAVGESRRVQFVNVDPAKVPGGVSPVTDSDLRAYYQQHIAQFQTKEQVKVRHILIAVKDPSQDAAALKKAQDIEKQLKNGGDFAKLAEENSDDPGSKAKGGDLGFIQKGVTVPEFEQVAFSQQPGQISAPVKTQFGYHIIQTEEKQPAQTKSFDEVKAQLLPQVQRERELKAAQDFAIKIADEAKSGGLAKVAAKYHLNVETTDYLQRNGIISSLPESTQVMAQAFKAKPGSAPQVAPTGEGWVVFGVTDTKAAHAPDFASYKDHVLQDYRNDKATELMQQKMQQVADAAKSSGDLEKAAQAAGATVGTSDLVGRDGQVPQIGAVSQNADAIFALNQGQVSGPLSGAGGVFIVKLLDKQEPAQQDIQAHFDETREKLLNDKREQIFELYVSDLQSRYDKEKRILVMKRKGRSALDTGM